MEGEKKTTLKVFQLHSPLAVLDAEEPSISACLQLELIPFPEKPMPLIRRRTASLATYPFWRRESSAHVLHPHLQLQTSPALPELMVTDTSIPWQEGHTPQSQTHKREK